MTGGGPATSVSEGARFFAPTLVKDCTNDMDIMRSESFGPVLGVCPVDGDEQAVQRINDSDFGLTSAIFSQDVERANRMAPQLEVGTVFLNRCDYLDPDLPWGGTKGTGKGVSLSRHGFRGVTKMKGFHFKLP